MRKKRTRNLKVSERGVLRYRNNLSDGGSSIRVYLQDASEPDRPHLLALDVASASELVRRLSKAISLDDRLDRPEIKAVS